MAMMGYSKTGTNLIYRQLLKNLTSFGSDPIDLRIGGNSTDNNGRPSGDRMKPYRGGSFNLCIRDLFWVSV